MGFVAEYGWIWGFSLAGFLMLWPISLWRRDCSVVDFWWGPGFGAMAIALWVSMGSPTDGFTLALMLPLLFWSMRLGIQLGLRRIREGHEDPRYTEMREARAPNWGIKSLFMVFILQAVVQGLVGVGVLAGIAAAPSAEVTALVYVLAGIATIAALVEMLSDLQLDIYRSKVPKGGLLTTGLRAYVRYPSYTAEIVFWVALSLMGMLAGVWWAGLSAALVVLLLRYVSGVTILEERMARTRPDFARYQQTVPMLWPNWRQIFDRTPPPHSGTPAE
ncbi:MAG: DUF1295 domain-containing protein [Pseudomonadota bacterium]